MYFQEKIKNVNEENVIFKLSLLLLRNFVVTSIKAVRACFSITVNVKNETLISFLKSKPTKTPSVIFIPIIKLKNICLRDWNSQPSLLKRFSKFLASSNLMCNGGKITSDLTKGSNWFLMAPFSFIKRCDRPLLSYL